MSSLCVDPNEVRGLNLFGNYYVDGKQQQTTDIVAEYTIPSGTSIMISALAAGNAQGWGREFPPTTFSSTEYGDETFLRHQSPSFCSATSRFGLAPPPPNTIFIHAILSDEIIEIWILRPDLLFGLFKVTKCRRGKRKYIKKSSLLWKLK